MESYKCLYSAHKVKLYGVNNRSFNNNLYKNQILFNMHSYFNAIKLTILTLHCFNYLTYGEVVNTDLNELSEQQNSIKINKCCEPNELMVDSVCRLAKQYNQSKYLKYNLNIACILLREQKYQH